MAFAFSCVRFLLIPAIFLLIFARHAGSYTLGASEGDAESAISEANEKIVVCYAAAAAADEAGANVTALAVALDEAGELLSRARLSFEQGDFDSAIILADQIKGDLNDFAAQAEALTESAILERFLSLFTTVVGSVIGIVVVVLSSYGVWLLIKRRYGQTERSAES